MISSLSSYLPTVPFLKGNITIAKTDPVFLLQAVQSGDLESLKENLPGFKPEFINMLINGESLLSAAIKVGSIPLVEYLIQEGAKFDVADQQKLTPLDYAALSPRSEEILPVLVSQWISRDKDLIGAYTNDAALMEHATQSLKQLEINVNAISSSPLFNLIKIYVNNPAEKEKIVETLCPMAGQALDQRGTTLLHLLACLAPLAPDAFSELLKSLVEKGVDPNIQNCFGQTPMHTACAYKSPLIHALSTLGCDFFQHDNQGIPPVALISIDPSRKDPLKLESSEVWIAAFVVLNQATNLLLNEATSRHLIAGIVTIPALANYSLLTAQWVLLIKQRGISSVLPNIFQTVLLHSLLNGLSFLKGEQILPMLSMMTTGLVMVSAFRGLNSAWKNRDWNPTIALRNGVVHSINFSHTMFQNVKSLSALANQIFHASYNRYDKVKELHSDLLEWNKQKEDLKTRTIEVLLKDKCDKNLMSQDLCKELATIKDKYVDGDKLISDKLTCIGPKLKAAQEEINSKNLLTSIWDYVLGNKSPTEQNLEILGIDPSSEAYKNNPASVIKTKFKALALQTHTDKISKNNTNTSNITATGLRPFADIRAAYEALTNDDNC